MSVAGNGFIGSGTRVATFGAMGFFSAGVLHLGAAATVGTLGTAAAAGFAGGLALYAPVVALRFIMMQCGLFNKGHQVLMVAMDLASMVAALPVGAWWLGLAVQPFLIAAAVACALYVAFNIVHLVAREVNNNSRHSGRELERNASVALSSPYSIPNAEKVDEQVDRAYYSIGAFC